MEGVPPATPETVPAPAPELTTVASEILLLLHVPPPVPSAKTVVKPTHTEGEPEIANGVWLTVITEVAIHPVGNIYVIVTTPPGVIPPTTPVDEPTVAMDPLLLVHVPPPASLKPIFDPVHTVLAPLIADGKGLTVTGNVAIQPVGNV